MGQHFDEDGDGVADRTEPDAQTVAFTGAAELDWVSELPADAVVHYPGDRDAPPIRTPEEWNADDWDAGRDGPKSLEEATDALVTRIADPRAPDTEAHRSAYSEGMR